MIKTIIMVSALVLGLGGYAVAQEPTSTHHHHQNHHHKAAPKPVKLCEGCLF
jgi:hypothetical protein